MLAIWSDGHCPRCVHPIHDYQGTYGRSTACALTSTDTHMSLPFQETRHERRALRSAKAVSMSGNLAGLRCDVACRRQCIGPSRVFLTFAKRYATHLI
ncbi:unnamed protein product [Toxocara canis]|nr:unnamed protein product [Toxocara canis]